LQVSHLAQLAGHDMESTLDPKISNLDPLEIFMGFGFVCLDSSLVSSPIQIHFNLLSGFIIKPI